MDLPSVAFEAMRAMALEPSKRVALVQDQTCMGGLVLILSNPDPQIVGQALDILLILAEYPEHRHPLKNILGLMSQLDSLDSHDSQHIRDTSRRIANLIHSGPLRNTANKPRPSEQQKPAVKKEQSQRKRRNSFFVSGGIAKSKIIVLQIRGLNDRDDVDTCRNCLLTVKGVISITVDFARRRATLRTRPEVAPETLAKAISRTMTMVAEQVVKDEEGAERLVSFSAAAASANKENEELPDYPSEDDSPVTGDKNVARIRRDDKDDGWSFAKSVGNFLSNSFYW